MTVEAKPSSHHHSLLSLDGRPLTTTASAAASSSSLSPSSSAPRSSELGQRQDAFEIGRYGLTPASVARDQSFVAVASSTASDPAYLAAPPIPRPAHTWKPPENGGFVRPTLDQRPEKRPADQRAHDGRSRSPPVKKHRRLPPPGKIDLGHIHPPRTPAELRITNGVSPLFFSSSSSRHMTGRPPSFSTTEPAAALLNRLRDEQGIVKTVRLAKGTASTASPARAHSLSTPTSTSSDSQSSRSGDYRHVPAELRDLHDWSVLDLLEADERPTFIIDLANSVNHESGLLKIVFVNASLRAAQGVHELITQDADINRDFSRFKSWILSFVKDNRSMNVCLPSFSYGGVSWTCSTLGGRFRFISGNSSAVSITPTSPAPPARASSVLEQRSQGNTPTRDMIAPVRDRALSDSDYFGDAEPDLKALANRRSHSEPRYMDDMRPDTPIVPSREEIDQELDSELAQTFDWTRIVDISGKFPPLCSAETLQPFTLSLEFLA